MNQPHLFDDESTARWTPVRATPFGSDPAKRRQDIATPAHIVLELSRAIGVHFTLDVCAAPDTRVACRWFGPGHHDENMRDAFHADWRMAGKSWAWMNPPFNDIEAWLALAIRRVVEEQLAAGCCILLPNRSSMPWAHVAAVHPHIVKFIRRGRFDFKNAGGSPFEHPCALAVFRDVDAARALRGPS